MNINRPTKEQVRLLVSEDVLAQYMRGHCDIDTAVELDNLHDILVDAAQAYASGPRQERQAVCNAVIAISVFLEGQGFSNATLAPIKRILAAVVDLSEQNRPDPMFCEKSKKTKSRRSMQDSVRQGHLAAFADVWIMSHPNDGSDELSKLKLAARRLSGTYFGKLEVNSLRNAKSYQRQTGQHDLVYSSYEQMSKALAAEAKSAGGDAEGLRIALELQIDALNAKAELRKT